MCNLKVCTRLTEGSEKGYKVYKVFYSAMCEAVKTLKKEGFYPLDKKDFFSDWSHPSGKTAYIVLDKC